ncbi:uncharacterized protein F54H12.2 [Trichonephila clavata]|uniref:Uncharacterized protein F54H12.2 n=1 Tax=Trichonephila clavata TaxID=2740835 RepID=A0A8X6M192_TRICU|nr:uncharacterized protein F54H12.2 [Trichonephila clavata]
MSTKEDQMVLNYQRPLYFPLRKNYIDCIEIELKSSSGDEWFGYKKKEIPQRKSFASCQAKSKETKRNKHILVVIWIFPVASLSHKTPIEFYVSGSGEHYLDLAHTLLHLQVKIKKRNGTILGAPDQVAPINYLPNTLFSERSVTLNDKQVSSQANYSYRCIFDALLSPRAVQKSMLTSGLFYKDADSKHESVELANGSDNINPGYQTRYNICKDSNLIDMIGPLHFDLGNQSKCLINSVNFRVKLERNKDSFALMSATQDFKILILHASLFVRKVKVAPSILTAHEVALSKGVIKMPIRRTEVKSFALS